MRYTIGKIRNLGVMRQESNWNNTKIIRVRATSPLCGDANKGRFAGNILGDSETTPVPWKESAQMSEKIS